MRRTWIERTIQMVLLNVVYKHRVVKYAFGFISLLLNVILIHNIYSSEIYMKKLGEFLI